VTPFLFPAAHPTRSIRVLQEQMTDNNGAKGMRCEPHLWFMAGKAVTVTVERSRKLPRYK